MLPLPESSPRWRLRAFSRLPMLGWAFVLALVCSPALASQLFHSPSDDGIPGAPEVPTGGVQSVFLYLDGGAVGTAAGETCNDGDGDEICGFDLELTALSGLSFSAFTPDAGADLLVNFAAASVLINGLDAVTPAAGPVRIGELQVNAIEGGQVELTSGEVIGADLGSEVLSAQTIVTVPEPGHLLLLVSGIGLLVGLARKGAN